MHWFLFLVAVSLVTVTNWRLRHLDPSHLRAQFVFRANDFQEIASSWRSRGQLQIYRRFVVVDFVTLVCYGAFGYFWASTAPEFAVLAGSHQSAALLLPIAALADACENLLHLRFTTTQAPPASPLAYPLAGVLSLVKFLAIVVFVLAASYSFACSAG